MTRIRAMIGSMRLMSPVIFLFTNACSSPTVRHPEISSDRAVEENTAEERSGNKITRKIEDKQVRPKGSYRLPPFEVRTLANGLQILFVTDSSLPYLSLSLLVRTGTVQDPENLSGLSSMVSELLDKGTKKRTAPQLAEDMGQIGAEIETAAGPEFTLVSASALSGKADPLLRTMVEIVTEPTFSEAEIDRIRQQTLSAIRRLEDNPEAFSNEVFKRSLYGQHPYGYPVLGSLKSVAEIKKKNIIQYYLRYYRPNNSILAVVGKLTPTLKEKIAREFSAWQKREIPTVELATAPTIKGRELLVVDKPGLVQAQIRFGNIGIARKSEDFLSVRVANTILGAPSLSSRLNDRVRRDLGLTYSIHSIFDARQTPGPFIIETFTKNNSIAQTINETLKVVQDFHDKGVSSSEVEDAKGYLKGVFPQSIETPEKLAYNLLLLRFYGIPDSYLTNYLTDLDALSVSDVNRSIKKYFDDQNLKILVYSNAAEAAEQLKNVDATVSNRKAADFQ